MEKIQLTEISEIDLVKHCNEYKAQILAQIGVNSSLPHQIDDTDYIYDDKGCR